MASEKDIHPPEIDWRDGAPFSPAFDDIYFSDDGIAETEHVFLRGNNLPDRFAHKQRFTIGELGFGTGLNFLVAWRAWKAAKKPRGAKFHFLSVEQFPLDADDLRRAHRRWPELTDMPLCLRDALPPRHPGIHHCVIDDDVTLTLVYGEAGVWVPQLQANVDAWFLDGFAPSRNPDMWSPALMAQLARLSTPGASFATFTVARSVRDALNSAGFQDAKEKGFGRKRDMLVGALKAPPEHTSIAPWFAAPRAFSAPQTVAIIGAGIAGAALYNALRRAGLNPTIFERKAPASGASGNPAGLITPRLDADDTAPGRFHVSAYFKSLRLFQSFGSEVFRPCGVVRMPTSERETVRQNKLVATQALPAGWIAKTENGVSFPQAGVVDPSALVHALLKDAQVEIASIERLVRMENCWRLIDSENNEFAADAVIVANGLDALRFEQARGLPIAGSAGQIDWFKDASAPEQALTFGAYAVPAPGGGLVIGATYAPITIGAIARFTPEATASNIKAIARHAPDLAAQLEATAAQPRAAIRATTPDRMPIVGAAPDWGFYGGAYDGLRTGKVMNYPAAQYLENLYFLTGLGSRGLTTAPLAAEMIAAAMTGTPAPVDISVAQATHPARFFIRDLKRKQS